MTPKGKAAFTVDKPKCVAPEAREMPGIPESHYMKLIVGFGYPEIPYARGVQKGGHKVRRHAEQSGGQLSLT